MKEILKLHDKRKILAWTFPKNGVIDFGIPGYSTCLYAAMGFSSPEIVVALLKAGASTSACDIMGNDSFSAACCMGRLDNVQVWLSRVSNYDINRKNKRFGATALHITVFIGRNKLKLVRYLVEKCNADTNVITHMGSSLLHNACENVDADPQVVKYLLQNRSNVNYCRTVRTTKSKALYFLARAYHRVSKSSRILNELAFESGCTSLHYVVRSGDVELTELLLSKNMTRKSTLEC